MIAQAEVVEVRRIVAMGPDQWIPARVIDRATGRFAVEALGGQEFSPGQNRLWLQERAKGETWR